MNKKSNLVYCQVVLRHGLERTGGKTSTEHKQNFCPCMSYAFLFRLNSSLYKLPKVYKIERKKQSVQ